MQRLETIDAVVERYSVTSSKIKSRVYVTLGVIFLVFAIIGILSIKNK